MKKKSILLAVIAILCISTATMAQVPNYLPTDGLVGWWPFNGNANDESGNGNNGIVNGATLTNDRFGNADKAFNFNGLSNYIKVNPLYSLDNTDDLSISVFILPTSTTGFRQFIVSRGYDYTYGSFFVCHESNQNSDKVRYSMNGYTEFNILTLNSYSIPYSNWQHLVVVKSDTIVKIYVNGIVTDSSSYSYPLATNTDSVYFGVHRFTDQIPDWFPYYFNGNIDDIGIWNRALTQKEITDLFNVANCAYNLTITPANNQLSIGSTATFHATTSDPDPSFVWQSELGQGFQFLNNFGNYSGVNTNTLSIANVQLSEHNQQIRVISTSGDCIDTSNVAIISILDTCITNVTVYDTIFTSVTDTLIINVSLSVINPPNNLNTLKVYPNPAKTHITIHYGNFTSMSGYSLKIVNSIGQTVFTTPINQQTSYISLSTWQGNGIYFLQLIDPQNNTIENRKIVIQ